MRSRKRLSAAITGKDVFDIMLPAHQKDPAGPPGFAYRQDALADIEEQRFISLFQELPFEPFDFHGFKGNRRIVSFGWRYDYGVQRLRQAEATPNWLEPLKKIAAQFSNLAPEDWRHALVTEYAPGAGIGWHRDKPMFQDVAAFSFLSPCSLRFRLKQGDGWLRHTIRVAPRSLYLLRGPAREQWEHSIPPLGSLRYSVTLRNFKPYTRIPLED